MVSMLESFEEQIMKKPALFTWRRVWIAIGILLALAIFLFGALVVQAKYYEDRVVPGLRIGEVAISGMTKSELKNFFHSMNDRLSSEGLAFSFDYKGEEKSFELQPVIVTEDNAIELLYINVDNEVDRIMSYGKDSNILFRAIDFEKMRFEKPSIKIQNIVLDKDKIISELEEKLTDYAVKPADASVKIDSVYPLQYEITSSSVGNVYMYEEAVNELESSWSALKVPDIKIKNKEVIPSIVESDVETIVNRLQNVFDSGNISLTYKEPETKRSYEWLIDTNKIAEWLDVQKNSKENLAFGLDKGLVSDYFESVIIPKINVEAQDAKFEIDDDGNVIEFQSSHPGVQLNVEETYDALNQAILERTSHDEGIAKTVQVIISKEEPNVSTGEANDLGITEVLGVGVSDFSGSPTNRIKNIRNGVKKLNGVLIKPGEEFSAIQYTKPYTEEGGYLPELVIKGNEIKPEVGGGLCQIGTTLFRMAMNAGMQITQRRNHSLVVSYYNDLNNGLPGTDATIYDPAPDFRFKNDTENYVLIQTYMDETEHRLYFTLWGTDDGRKGYYESPVVTKWIDYGPTQYIETTDLPVGQEKCQHAYRGAEASFKYIREMPDGEEEEKVFDSYYRPLPEICLVGVEQKVENCFDESGQLLAECPPEENADGSPIIAE